MLKAEIIAVGSELLAGTTVNTNGAYLARHLAMVGYDVHHQCVVPDSAEAIDAATREALSRSHVVVYCGGLGPTDDDLTKESVAKTLGIKLVRDEESEQAMRAFFAQRGKAMTDNNLKQAMIYEGCTVLKNPNGTAPGIFLRRGNQAIALLPGPPFEMQPMFENELEPLLVEMSPVKVAHAGLRIFGIGESELETLCHDLLYGTNPVSACYAKPWGVHINIYSRSETEAEAKSLLDEKVAAYRERTGDCLVSDCGEELEEVVVHLLDKNKKHLALAESCTGGLVAQLITSVPGASKVFDLGIVSYSNRAKHSALKVDSAILRKYSAVSSAAAAEMAKGALAAAKADYAVAITGIAGPTNEGYIDKPVGLVYIAIADKTRVYIKKFNFGNMRSRDSIRELSARHALDMVRRIASGLNINGAKAFSHKSIADMDARRPRKKATLAVERAVAGTLAAAIVLFGVYTGTQALRRKVSEGVYDELQQTYTSTQATDAVLALSEQNPDTYGWLTSMNGGIDCVVVQGNGDDYYETHDFSGSKNSLGCPYTEPTDGNTDRNLVIYGSSSDAQKIFGSLRSFVDDKATDLAAQNYLFDLTTVGGIYSYKLAAICIVNTNSEYGEVSDFYKKKSFASDDEFTDFVVEMKLRSCINANTSIVSTDTFLTLVTDLDGWEGEKLVVIARRLRDGEASTMSAQMFTKNMTALYPDMYYELAGTSSNVNLTIEKDKWRNWLLTNEKNLGTDTYTGQSNGGNIPDSGDAAIAPTLTGGIASITVNMNGSSITDTPQNIVSRMVAYELNDGFNDEAIKALAVACGSWLKYSINAGIMPSVSGASPSEHITALVGSVINEGIFYNDSLAFTPFYQISSGKTNTSADAFEITLPYLISVDSIYDYQVSGYSSEVSFSLDVLKSRLEQYYETTLSGSYENWIIIESTNDGGYVGNVHVGSISTTGTELAEKCLGLNSSCFEITYDDSHAYFSVKGSGHGVGMSICGANEYAIAAGWNYQDILLHYYPGTEISELKWVSTTTNE